MQLHLEADELNLLANLLMESANAPQLEKPVDDLLEMVLARDLRLDSDQLERAANVLAAAKRSMKEEISREPNASRRSGLQQKLALLERVQERVDEACVMF
ncbi:MAG TPA: hypothetical protein VMU45_07670 [Candidatus Eisenbacteria bacterium]|nr:hypothetical protein [Candidatus Eisenbacteria bacterium]